MKLVDLRSDTVTRPSPGMREAMARAEVGDDVLVEFPDKTLHFTVQYAKVVDPKDLSVLLPISSTGRNLTLMTCVPPGTNIKRLVVITSLI